MTESKSKLDKFLHSICDDLKLDLKSKSTPDYTVNNGNLFQKTNWSRDRSLSQENGDYDYFLPTDQDDEQNEDLLDTLLASLHGQEDDYVSTATTLPSSIPRSTALQVTEMSYFGGSIFSKEMFTSSSYFPTPHRYYLLLQLP